MSIEEEIFKRAIVDYNKLEKNGFKKIGNEYVCYASLLKDDFKAIITVDENGIVTGKIIDTQLNEEYTNFRTDMTGEFVSTIRELYKKLLIDIKNNCFNEKHYIFDQTNRVIKYVKDKYSTDPEFLWKEYPGFGVLRNMTSMKWYGLIGNIDYSKLGKKKGEIEIINVKLNREEIQDLLKDEGFYEAYHMNKKDWISIVLDDTVSDDNIFSLIDKSYNMVSKKH